MSTLQPRFSEGSDTESLSHALKPLLTSSGGRWSLTSNGQGLERPFKFKTFAKTWDFMTAVSLQCKIKNHHPEWSNVYNMTFIRWTTHNPEGLSAKDVDLAAVCDSLAKDFGETQETLETAQSCTLKTLADGTASTAGDCCTPKPKP
ncbi:hypothetical protein NKR23_g8153 [Pleurostoma richardsiae]|uniref:4a-hydroxytetrahydrobiopterin dehydratase n=1 Tax=Pleurostoma richardsiae TaxID=41990 RepID=A0AA38RIY3_9PEZI|nr:hypothetical protein NKR23_g8153 [Pleurostoma richardsiae]